MSQLIPNDYCQKPLVQLVELGEKHLSTTSDSAKLDAQILLCLVLDKPTSYLLTWPEKTISAECISQYFELLVQRQLGKPIAYLTGYKEFWSLEFEVSPATLIPRPDTETLVELVLDLVVSDTFLSNNTLLDLGTGTGAIALALASELSSWHIDAIDYSQAAVDLAKRNQKRLVIDNVNIFQSDWFNQIGDEKRYSIIVSNPPYIDANDKHLFEGDVRFEPSSALVAEQQGFSDLIHIATQAKTHLISGGYLFLEHGYEQGETLREQLTVLGYHHVQTSPDLSGNDRITWASYTHTE